MPTSRRIVRMRELLKEEIGQLLLREVDLPSAVFLTVKDVLVSSDLAHAAVHVSIFPEDAIKETMMMLEERTPQFQHFLNRRLPLRPMPKIYFSLDQSDAQADTVERILRNINE